jgi:DNA-binding LacI/PurR family transcriptional regulator
MIDENPGATAIIAANDLVAIGAASTLLDQGVKIPENISVVGFGNTLTAEYFRVPLTTISQPKYRRGTAAIESMEKLLAGEKASFKRLPADLVIRKSTSAPPG